MDSLDLSRRAVAAGWKWQRGALAVGMREIPSAWFRVEEPVARLTGDWSDAMPDFNDPATRGVLLQQVRERWDDIGLYVQGQYSNGIWDWRVWGGKPHGGRFNLATEIWHDSETAALVCAMEAAPNR